MFGRKKEKTKKSTKNTAQNIQTKTETRADAKKRIKRERIVQNVIHYNKMLQNGICCLDNDIYSETIAFSDINYQIAKEDVKKQIINSYKNILNSTGSSIDVSLTVNNRLVNENEFNEKILLKPKGDGLDELRSEMNIYLRNNMKKGNNSIISDKMITFSVKEENYKKAETSLKGIENSFRNQLEELKCKTHVLDGEERLKQLHSIIKPTEDFQFSYKDLKMGATTKECIVPYSFNFENKDYFEMGNRYCCAMILSKYPKYLGDDLIKELSKIDANLVITFHMQMLSRDETMTEIKRIETLLDIQRENEDDKSFIKGRMPEKYSKTLEESLEDIARLRQAVKEFDERLFNTQFIVLVNANSYEEMIEIQKQVLRKGKACSCEFIPMEYEQEMGFNAVLPLGLPKEGLSRSLLTDNCANIMPFISQELYQTHNPICYGINQTTNNMILGNRNTLNNTNGFILGKSGIGKSFFSKEEMTWNFLSEPDTDFVIIDPQGEYRIVAETLNKYSNQPQCAIIDVNNKSKLHFNPFDGDITQDDFVQDKAIFIQVIMAEMIGNGTLMPEEKSIIDQIVYMMYDDYREALLAKRFDKAQMPTLETFYSYLDKNIYKENVVAQRMKEALWTYVYGSGNMFAHESNFDVDSRMLVYDISELGTTIRTLGLKVVLESVRTLVLKNSKLGRRTYVYIDEIYLLLKDEYSENFLYEFWKWVRKFGGSCTGMTQNVSDMLRSQKGQTMLSNSEFWIMLGQDNLDLEQLRLILNLSDEQMRFVETARKGSGLIRFGDAIIPFINEFPKDTKCFEMWQTDPKKVNQRAEEIRNLQHEASEFKKAQNKERKEKERKFQQGLNNLNKESMKDGLKEHTIAPKDGNIAMKPKPESDDELIKISGLNFDQY